MYALGLIEVKGFLAAVVAADTALKSAHVILNNVEKIRGGYITIQLTGDVAAVQVAVESGVEAVKVLEIHVNSHVIARVHSETEKILRRESNMIHKTEKKNQSIIEVAQSVTLEETKEEFNEILTKLDKEEYLTRNELEKMTVNALRKRIRKSGFGLDSKTINYARKDTLINMLLNKERKDDSDVDGR